MKTQSKSKLQDKISSLLIVAILISTLQSCVKDNFQFNKIAEIKWDPNVAAPLVYGSLSIKDILNKSNAPNFIIEAGDHSLTLVYKGNLFSLDASNLVNLPDQTFPFSASVGTGLPIPFTTGNNFMGSYSQTVSFGTGGPSIDSITFKTGILAFSFNSDLHNSGTIKITIPSAKKNGVVFSNTLPLNYTGAVPIVASANYDLTGYNFDMTSGGAPDNQFIINYDVTINGSATAPGGAEQVAVSLSMNNMLFSKIFGDIGQQNLSIATDTIDLSIFTNSVAGGGSFTLANPSVKITLSNSFGVPIGAHLSTFEGYNPGVNFYPITGFPDPLPIPSPTFTPINQVGQTLVDSFQLDKTNSNIVTILNNTPKQIIYKVDAKSNPAGATHNNFILDTSHFKIDVEFDLPLYGTAKNFMLVDTTAFSFSQNIPDQVESGIIRTYNANGFPMDIDLQVYFVDSLYTKLDSLVIIPNFILLKSGVVNLTTGRVTSPTETIYDATFDKTRLQKLKNATKIIIHAIASTTNAGTTDVKIYSDYKLDVKLGVQLQLHIQASR